MDILAHALWARAGFAFLDRRRGVDRASIRWALGLAVMPDVLHNLPVLAWALLSGAPGDWWAYVVALPGREPVFPAWVALWSQQLHCWLHSALVALVISGLLYLIQRQFWLPLLGWWSHIVIDAFTHSADFYPSPVFYPLTSWGFDGQPWNTTWFSVLNYATLAGLGIWLFATRRNRTLHKGSRCTVAALAPSMRCPQAEAEHPSGSRVPGSCIT